MDASRLPHDLPLLILLITSSCSREVAEKCQIVRPIQSLSPMHGLLRYFNASLRGLCEMKSGIETPFDMTSFTSSEVGVLGLVSLPFK